MPHELRHGDYLISDDPARLDVGVIHDYLSRASYWAGGVPRELVERSLQNSLGLGVYAASGEQVGLARVVTDYATFGWLCDVFVLDAHRGHGLGKALVQAVVTHPRLQTLRRPVPRHPRRARPLRPVRLHPARRARPSDGAPQSDRIG